jgi:ABC-type hemin transport system substrate-binding protein
MQSATQAALQQLKVQQAKQNADRAEVAARSLRAQANAAQSEADRAQENARSLYVRSDRAETAAGQARQGVAMIQSSGEMRVRLADTASQAAERQTETQPVQPAPVVNTSGQVTGTVVNTTA